MMVDGTEATGGTTAGGSVDTTNRWSSVNSKVYNLYYGHGVPSWNTGSTVLEISGTDVTTGTGDAVASLRLVASSFYDNDNGDLSGSTYLFNTDGTGEVKLTPSDGEAYDLFGGSIATGHGKLAIAAHGDDDAADAAGAVYVYNTDGTGEFKITASDAQYNDQFGHGNGAGLAIGENKIIVGSSGVDDDANAYWTDTEGNPVHYWNNGAIYVYDLDGSNEVKITTSDPSYNDRFGSCVAIGGGKIVGGAPNEGAANNGLGTGSIYIFDLDGTNEIKITPSNVYQYAAFGNAVAIGDNKIAVGAWNENEGDVSGYQSSGAAFIYDMDGSNGIKIMPSDRSGKDRFGTSVAIGNGKVAIGARGPTSASDVPNSNSPNGSVYVYNLDGTGEVKITASDGNPLDQFGHSVTIMDGKILVGATMQHSGGNGAIYMYDIDGTNEVKITPSDLGSGDRFGHATAIAVGSVAGNVVGGSIETTDRWTSGNSKVYNLYSGHGVPSWNTSSTVLEVSSVPKIVVGVSNNDDAGTNSGSVYVYDLDGTNEIKITASDAAENDYFGGAVAVGNNKIVVGARQDGDNGYASGSVYVYDLDGTNEIKISASDGETGENFGYSVAVGDDKIAIGAYRDDDNGHYAGSVYVYDLDGSNEVKITASDGAESDEFGYSVAVGSNKIAVSARLDDDNGESSGAVYVYDLDGTNEVKITASDASANDQLGNQVAIGHDKIVVGAHKHDVKGAVYVYDLDGSNEVKITASDRDSLHQPNFGIRVAVGENKIAVGSWGDSSGGQNVGSIYVYDLDGSNEVKITASDGTAGTGFGDAFGYGVGIADGKVVASAIGRDANSNVDSGAIYVYDLDGSNEIKFSPSDVDSNDYAGLSIAVGE